MTGKGCAAVAILSLGCSSITAQSQNTGVDFANDIAPIIQASCVRCHGPGSHLAFTSRQALIDEKVLVPGDPAKSSFYSTLQQGSMPPGGKLPANQLGLIERWIRSGANWPSGAALAKTEKPTPTGAHTNVAPIRERILANREHTAADQSYKVTIPNTTVVYEMTPIPAGTFTMGSGEEKDEQPPHKVKVDGFWMQSHEVTWDEYRLFMFANQAGEIAHKDTLVDAVTRPTRPYMEMSFGMGINGFPAISMTQHAANKYAEWLSAKTGEFYRLPTEAEWEYACKAGSTASPNPLADYAWFKTNDNGKYQKVATKRPNGWGLFDMLGNVMEWTLDGYAPYQAGEQSNPWVKPTAPYPMVARGGSWNDAANALSCTARVASDPSWKEQDPQLPKSIWYETDAQWLGFRLVRPVQVPSTEEMFRYWNNGVEHDEQ